ncbi:MAG TPA: hypothetical protein VF905_10885 [Nitrospirota bacterium]
MTCIVGIELAGEVHLAADSGSFGDTTTLLAPEDSKVWRTGSYVMGSSGSPRFANLLRYTMKWPEPSAKDKATDPALFGFLVNRVAVPLRRLCVGQGLVMERGRDGDGEPLGDHGNVMVGVAGRLYTMHSDFSVERSTHGYAAIGTGADHAMGALYVLVAGSSFGRNDPELVGGRMGNRSTRALGQIQIALEAAEAHCSFVRKPWVKVSTLVARRQKKKSK